MADLKPWELADLEFACDHPETEIRKKTCSNGTVQWRRQCLRCGESTAGNLKKDSVHYLQRVQAVEFDETLREQWFERRRQRIDELTQAQSEQWWEEYNTYLSSMGWRIKRDAVLRRDKGLCQGCRQRQATQVHHLTYQRLRREMLFDLVAICDECHRAIHERNEGLER